MMIAEVMVDLKTNQILSAYDYIIPEGLRDFLSLGMRVIVPFNNTKRVGLITGFKKTSIEATKSIIEPFDLEPILNKEQLHLIDYVESEAMIPKNLAYFKIMPNALQLNYQKQVKVLKRNELITPLDTLLLREVQTFDSTWMTYASAFKKAESLKQIEINTIIKQKGQIKKHELYKQGFQVPLTKKQQELWSFLETEASLKEIREANFSKDMLQKLMKQGTILSRSVETFFEEKPRFERDDKSLTSHQKYALDTIGQALHSYHRFLLKGVSASGKTEVFLQLCLQLLKTHKQALILTVDEALIKQLADYLSPYISVVTIHKNSTPQARLDSHRAIQLGYASVLVSTPIGMFTPFKNLGLIIADEAQDAVYLDYAKSIHGLDILAERARFNKVPLVYASATPPVQLLYDAKMEKLKLIELTEKVHRSIDKLIVVDMKDELINGNLTMLSKPLHEAISQTLKDNKQALILANKSGYAPYVLCRSCGYVPTCEKCDSPLVYYKEKQILKCHHCGLKIKELHTCPSCKSEKIRPVGIAIEQVEAHLKKTFPSANVARLDAETTAHKGVYTQTIEAFKRKEIDILVGTQMISKGHDFDISVVGILLIDSMLKAPTYLANERTYQLIKQTMGRTGRKQSGTSIVQTYQTNHFVIRSLDDEDAFYEQELNRRMLLNYPPYSQLLTITFKGTDIDSTERAISHLKNNILAKYSQYEVIGPNDYAQNTFKIMIKTGKKQSLGSLVKWIKSYYEKPSMSVSFYRYDDTV